MQQLLLKSAKIGGVASRPRFVGFAPVRRPDEKPFVQLSFVAGTTLAAIKGDNDTVLIIDLMKESGDKSENPMQLTI
jgi:hypothetical protein